MSTLQQAVLPGNPDRSIRAAVVGAGLIGCSAEGPAMSGCRLTHAGGYHRHPAFELVAIADPDAEARRRASVWGCPVFDDIDVLMERAAPEVVSLCTPVAVRGALLERILDHPVRLVVAEKPLAPDSATIRRLLDRYRAAGVPLVVNFSRRFVDFYQDLRRRFLEQSDVLTVSIKYAKGLRHNGSHAIDLGRLLFGEVREAVALGARSDWGADDPTVSAFLRFERCPEFFLQALDERCFTLFEVDIVTATDRFRIDNDHRRLRRSFVQDGCGVPPGRRLVEGAGEAIAHESAIQNLMDDILRVLRTGGAPRCSGADALAVEIVVETLIGQLSVKVAASHDG